MWLETRFAAGLQKLNAGKRPVVLVKQTYTTGADLTKCLLAPGAGGAQQPGCKALSRSDVMAQFQSVDRMMDKVASGFSGATTLDPKAYFCPGEACTIRDGAALFLRDSDHLTNDGSAYLISRAKGELLKKIAGP